MPITLKEVLCHLEEIGYKVMVPEDQDSECGLRFATQSYTDPSGDRSLLIICKLSERGEYFEVFAPAAYSTQDCKFKTALFAAMLQVAYMTKHLQLEHDSTDGEVRFAIDFPVCDGTVTTRQLYAMVRCITQALEEYHPVFVHAMQTGKVDMDLAWRPEEPKQEAPQQAKPPIPPELAALLEKCGGVEGVERLLADQRSARGDAE
jgi:hypothetical protein